MATQIGDRNFALFGQESNGSTWALCRINMFLHEMDNARIEWCNAITNPRLVEGDNLMNFNFVVANPPFSLDKWGADEAANDRFHRSWRALFLPRVKVSTRSSATWSKLPWPPRAVWV